MNRRALRHLWHDSSAVAAPMIALLGTALIGVSGVALDVGLYFANERNLQAITEAAALSASLFPQDAQGRVEAFMVRNGYPASVVKSVQVGYYCPDITLGTGSRFIASTAALPDGCPTPATGPDAVQVQTSSQSQRYLTAVLGNSSVIPTLSGTATAARIDEAGVEMTSGVLSLDAGLVSSVLSLLAGRNLSLTSAQVQALLAAHVDAGLMFDALAARVGETGTYSDLTARTVSMGDLLNACATAMQTSGSDAVSIGAMQGLATAIGSNVQVPLAKLFQLGVWNKMPVGHANTQTSLRAGLNAYQLLAYGLEVNGGSLLGLNVNVSGVGQVSVNAMASSPIARARFGFGPSGEISVSTAAVRLQVGVAVNPTTLLASTGFVQAGTNLVSVNVPLLVDVGEGSATINAISCGQEASTDAQVEMNSTAGLLGVYVGTLPSDVMTQPFRSIAASDVQPASLLSVGIPSILGLPAVPVASVGIKAVAGPVIGGSAVQYFQQDAGADGVIGHVPSGGTPVPVGDQAELSNTLKNLQVNASVNALGIISISTGPLVSGVGGTVGSLVHVLGVDPLVTGLLGALGISAGYANTWVTGVRCGVPVLV